MARRRLSVTAPGEAVSRAKPGLTPPIAAVAGEAATLAAADAVTAELTSAREEGRLAIRVPLEMIDASHFARDRIGVDDEDMEALKASIAAHGQRMPLDVMAGEAGRYGLISGWRRLAALKALLAQTGEVRFEAALVVVRQPADAGAAYVAMVEENEIRVGLSYYERARIAALAAERGAFESAVAAVDALYASGSKAKRSKIRAFLGIHEALGDVLRHPQSLSERLGLALASGLKAGQEGPLRAALSASAATPEDEAQALMAALASPAPSKKAVSRAKPAAEPLAEGVVMTTSKGRVTLQGAGVTEAFVARLRKALGEG